MNFTAYKILVFTLFWSILSAQMAHASTKQIWLKATNGTVITLDYNIAYTDNSILANPVKISVTNNDLSQGQHKIRAVLLNIYENLRPSDNNLQSGQTIDLTPALNPNQYSASSQNVVLSTSGRGYGYNFRQELAIVVDGQWLQNPYGGNFQFKMSW